MLVIGIYPHVTWGAVVCIDSDDPDNITTDSVIDMRCTADTPLQEVAVAHAEAIDSFLERHEGVELHSVNMGIWAQYGQKAKLVHLDQSRIAYAVAGVLWGSTIHTVRFFNPKESRSIAAVRPRVHLERENTATREALDAAWAVICTLKYYELAAEFPELA